MILLISNSEHREQVAGALQKVLGNTVAVADLRHARERLKDGSAAAAVIDENLQYVNPSEYDKLLDRLGDTIPVLVNFGIHSAERAAREVVQAVQRAHRERALARQAVEWELRGELRSDITGLMVCMQQALAFPGLPEAVQQHLLSACQMADGLKSRLEPQA